MASDDEKMSRQAFSISYTGKDRLSDHTIDVNALGPALMAIGRLIREANREFNGKSATSKVLVVSDFEHRCFNINFEAVLTLIEQAKSLIGTADAKSAKEILEWLDLLVGGATGTAGTLGFLKFLKWRKGRKIESVQEIKDSDSSGAVVVRVEGEHSPVTVNQNVYNLINNTRALAATRDALSPIGVDGFDRMEVRNGDASVSEIDEKSANEIISSCRFGIEESKDTTPTIETTSAWLTVYSPVYEESADTWRFKLGTDVIYANISETSIAHDALQRGGAMVDDTYQVRLEIEIPKTIDGKAKRPNYKILEVIRFFPAEPNIQSELNLKNPQE